jgi:type I restriction enzyme, S subunit
MTTLPAQLTLGDICELVSKQVDPAAMPEATYLGLEHLATGRLLPISAGTASDVTSHKTAYEAGDVLVSKLRPYLDKAALAVKPGVCTTELLPLRAKEGIDPRFLACVVHRPDFVEHAMTGVTGAQHPRTSWGHLSRFGLPVIATEQQAAVADLLWKIHDLLVTVEATLVAATHLKDAAAIEVFARGLRREALVESAIGPVPKSWDVVALGQLGRLGNGSTPKRSVAAFWEEGSFPWLTSAKVYDRKIVAADQFVTPVALRDCHLPVLTPGAVLVAITGQGKTLGHCAELHIEATISQHLAYVQTDTEQILPQFLRYYLETQYEYLRQVASGGGSTKGALTCAFLRTLLVPVPSLREQRDVVTLIGTLERTIEIQAEKQHQLERLMRSLLEPMTSGQIHVGGAVAAPAPELETAA